MELKDLIETEATAEDSAQGVIAATSLNEVLYGNTANRYIARFNKFKMTHPAPTMLSEVIPYVAQFEMAYEWEEAVKPGLIPYVQYQILKHKLAKGTIINAKYREMFARNEEKRERVADLYMAINRTMSTLAKEGYSALPREMVVEVLELAGLVDTVSNVMRLLEAK
jgi:hypothetical protein